MTGQLNFYLSAVDDLMKHASDQPTIGLLLCRSKNKLEELEGSLPTVEQIEAELAPKTVKAMKTR